MDYLSVRRKRLWEAIEAWRGSADDLSDPQFADMAAQLAEHSELRIQFQRLQQADAAIKAVFINVPVPAGLADRVSGHLAEATQTNEAVPSTVSERLLPTADSLAVPTRITPDAPAPLRDGAVRLSRRRLLVGFTALSAAAALLAAVWIQTHLPRHDSPTSVLDEAMDFFGQDNQPFGELVEQVAPPAEYPLSRDIVRLQGVRWRRVTTFPGSPAVAYDLPTVGGRATLYALKRDVAGIPAIPPLLPMSSTGGKSAGAWQIADTLYVLVVEGDARKYSSYLDQSHGPLT